jgi:hypothetical protein
MRPSCLTLVSGLLTTLITPAAPMAAPVRGVDNVRAVGEVVADKGVLTARDARATLVIGAADADTYRLMAEVKSADKATRISLYVMPALERERRRQTLVT